MGTIIRVRKIPNPGIRLFKAYATTNPNTTCATTEETTYMAVFPRLDQKLGSLDYGDIIFDAVKRRERESEHSSYKRINR